MGYRLSSPQESGVILVAYLHFPGFSQNPFSVLHPALHSQPFERERKGQQRLRINNENTHKTLKNI